MFARSAAGTGTLNVYTTSNGQISRGQSSLWTLTGDQGDIWMSAKVTIRSPRDWQVRVVSRKIRKLTIEVRKFDPNQIETD